MSVKGLVTGSLLFLSSLVYAGPREDFQKEILILQQRMQQAPKCASCDVHVKIKQVIDVKVKEYYQKVSKKQWYEEMEALNNAVKKEYAKEFGIGLDFIVMEEWKHKDNMAFIETLYLDLIFIPPGKADLVVGMTKTVNLLAGDVGAGDSSGRGNYILVGADKTFGPFVFIHELAHLFQVPHSREKDSIMYEKYHDPEKKRHWDEQSKKILLANKYRSWQLSEIRQELHALDARLDLAGKEKLREFYRVLGFRRTLLSHYMGEREKILQETSKKVGALPAKKRQLYLKKINAVIDTQIKKNMKTYWVSYQASIDELIALYPREGYFYFYKAEAHREQEQKEQEVAAYEKALSLGIQFSELYNNLSMNYTESNPQRAVLLALEAVKKQQDREEFRDTLGWAYFHAGRYEDAERELEKVKTLSGNPEYLMHLGLTYNQLRKHDKAQGIFETVVSLNKEPFAQGAQMMLQMYREKR